MTNLLSNRAGRRVACLGGALLFAAQFAFAQAPEVPTSAIPLDDITERAVIAEHRSLPYQPIREADILWEKRISRIVDVREKRNQPFAAPESPLFKILPDAVMADELAAFSTDDDRFSKRLSADDVRAMLLRRDTIYTINFDTGEEEVRVVENETNWEDVKRFRLKEAWFFDAKTSTLRVQILGIAPLLDVKDENGDFRFEMPLFWVHYPSARPILAQHKAVTHAGNYAATTTWEDLLEMRQFASTITKENNVRDLRLEDSYAGTDLLLHAERIEDAIFNQEHDLWSW
jgi:gliding motility associated protien GldN